MSKGTRGGVKDSVRKGDFFWERTNYHRTVEGGSRGSYWVSEIENEVGDICLEGIS